MMQANVSHLIAVYLLANFVGPGESLHEFSKAEK